MQDLKKVLHRPKKLSTFIEKLYLDIKKDSIDLKNSIKSNKKDLLDTKKVLHRPKKLSTFIEKMLIDIKKDSHDLKNSIKSNRNRVQDIKKVLDKPKKSNTKKIYDNIENLFVSMKKQLVDIKNDSYDTKKSIKSHRKEILVIKENTYINKITFVKTGKPDVNGVIRNEIKILANNNTKIKNKFMVVNKCLNIFNKREQGNRNNINNTSIIIQNIKKGLRNAK